MSGPQQPYPDLAGVEVEDAKEVFRRLIRTNRRNRSTAKRDAAAEAIADVFDTVPEVTEAACVSVYVSRPGEPDTSVLLDRLRARGVRILLPVLGDGLQRLWAEDKGRDDLVERAPGRPPEPSGPFLPFEDLRSANVIIVPALAVDTNGLRLGQGGGWYDRALEHAHPNAMTIAVTFPEEIYDADPRPLPSEEHDRAVDAVVTPEGFSAIPIQRHT